MAGRTFGQALGALVLQKRRAAGLTQVQLAEDAFGTSGKTRRISELETGSVANPHPRTIDPIIAVLGISSTEIEECAKKVGNQPDQELDRAYREARNLIDAVARQFEHTQPSASLAELDQFLRAKAREWAELRDRIESIEAEEGVLSGIKDAASIALNDGEFAEVDRLLTIAEEQYQKNRTLNEVQKHAELRIIRGDSFFFQGDSKTALQLYKSAVEFYRPFDEQEMAKKINEIASTIYELSSRSIFPAFYVAGEMLEILLDLKTVKDEEFSRNEALYQLGLTYRNEHDNPLSTLKEEALKKAIHFSSLAVASLDTQGNVNQSAMSKIGLANCLRDRAKATSNAQDLEQAIVLLQSAKTELQSDTGSRDLLPCACNSLGAVFNAFQLMREADRMPNASDFAFDAFSEAASVSEEVGDTEVWGVSKFNMAIILDGRADNENLGEKERHFLRIRAIAEIGAANETFPSAFFPYRFADVKETQGRILFKHALLLNNVELSEVYLFRAVQSLEVAADILNEDQHPLRWAQLQAQLGSVFFQHATFAEKRIAEQDYNRAIEHYESALSVFEGNKSDAQADICRGAVARIRSDLKELLSGEAESQT